MLTIPRPSFLRTSLICLNPRRQDIGWVSIDRQGIQGYSTQQIAHRNITMPANVKSNVVVFDSDELINNFFRIARRYFSGYQ
ncbi:unnamed protein product [Haemonchus placei]|uniref:Type II toxin-antitoxin system PemK/MazF family toxin n=1 Tax=Haemonchus placei TaxID=6290 RepID=A0A0N4VVR1_HAEPC|nr:unnamed protein product [Haemonchus placei]